MFQLTRQFIINDNTSKIKKGALAGKRFAVNSAKDTLLIAGMANLRKEDIKAVYKHVAEGAKEEKVTIAATTPGNPSAELAPTPAIYNAGSEYGGYTARLVITISQEGRVISTVNDQYPIHTKDYVYETEIDSTGNISFTKLAEVAAREEAMEFPDRLITIDGSVNLVISALDCYTRIDAVRLVVVPLISAETTSETLTGYKNYNVIIDWHRKDSILAGSPYTVGKVTLTPGKLGAGTVDHILHNLMLQTAANTNPYGVNMDERPLPNGEYDQYTIQYVTTRNNVGHQVLGSVDHSLVTFVFFVESSLNKPNTASKAFEDALKTGLGLTVVTA